MLLFWGYDVLMLAILMGVTFNWVKVLEHKYKNGGEHDGAITVKKLDIDDFGGQCLSHRSGSDSGVGAGQCVFLSVGESANAGSLLAG